MDLVGVYESLWDVRWDRRCWSGGADRRQDYD